MTRKSFDKKISPAMRIMRNLFIECDMLLVQYSNETNKTEKKILNERVAEIRNRIINCCVDLTILEGYFSVK